MYSIFKMSVQTIEKLNIIKFAIEILTFIVLIWSTNLIFK